MSKNNPLSITKIRNETTKKFLEEYSSWSYLKTQEALQRVQVRDQWYQMSFREVCEDALRLVELNELHAIKYEYLVGQMQKRGYGDLFEHIMGQPISEALLK